jgi:hypothetical protein
MKLIKIFQVPLALFLTLSIITPLRAEEDPVLPREAARPAPGVGVAGRPERAPAGDGLERGPAAGPAAAGIAIANERRAADSKPPLTEAQAAAASLAIGNAGRTGQPVTPARAAAIAASVTNINETRAAAGQAPLTQGQTNQVVNAVMWGAQFVAPAGGRAAIDAGNLGFTVTHNGTEARVVMDAGSITNNMRIVVPGATSGPVALRSERDGSVQFAMTTNVINAPNARLGIAGSAQFTQATVLTAGMEAGAVNNRGFAGAGNIGGHVANAAGFERPGGGQIARGAGPGQIALQGAPPAIADGVEVRVSAARITNPADATHQIALNYAFTGPSPTSPSMHTPDATTTVAPPSGSTPRMPGATNLTFPGEHGEPGSVNITGNRANLNVGSGTGFPGSVAVPAPGATPGPANAIQVTFQTSAGPVVVQGMRNADTISATLNLQPGQAQQIAGATSFAISPAGQPPTPENSTSFNNVQAVASPAAPPVGALVPQAARMFAGVETNLTRAPGGNYTFTGPPSQVGSAGSPGTNSPLAGLIFHMIDHPMTPPAARAALQAGIFQSGGSSTARSDVNMSITFNPSTQRVSGITVAAPTPANPNATFTYHPPAAQMDELIRQLAAR